MNHTGSELNPGNGTKKGRTRHSSLFSGGARIWLQASRMPSQLYIFLPLLLGQSMAFTQGSFSWKIFVLCHLYGLFVQFFIVFVALCGSFSLTPMAGFSMTLFFR
jgi:hypothetical protein